MDFSERTRIARANLEGFLAANFTGGEYLPDDTQFAAKMSIGIYSPVKNVKSLSLLHANKVLLLDAFEGSPNSAELNILAYRTTLAWQKIMPEPLSELKLLLDKIVDSNTTGEAHTEENTLFLLEQAQAHLLFYENDKAEECIQKALISCGLENVELAGKLGKRTRFQQKVIAQLVVTANINKQSIIDEDNDIPTDVALNDDTVLEKIAFSEEEDSMQFSDDHLAAILTLCRFTRRTEPMDDLLLEKCSAFLSLVIGSKRCWAVQAAALLLRSGMERNSKRRVERACCQSELIVKLMEGIDDETPVEARRKRARYVLASGLEPVWSAKVIHAEILRSLGVTSEALLIYEQLELWDHVVDCYKSLGQLEKANSLIHDLLKTRPNDSMLYVYLGDINQQESYYEKAIEVSNDRNAKAHKALGHMLLMRNQYEKAWTHLKRSVELQPVQFGVWFNVGHCSWKLERYESAISSYHRCVCLEPDNFEAWNNLSAAYIRLGEKERAKLTMQEALKFNYEHAKVWENYLLVCIDTADFGQAIQAFNRLLDLNTKQRDDEVLEIMAGEVLKKLCDELSENHRQELIKLKAELVKLFGRITASQTLSSKAWRLYAELKRPASYDEIEFSKYIELLKKAFSADIKSPTWMKEESRCISTLETASAVADALLEDAEKKSTEEAQKKARAWIRLSLTSPVTIVEKYYSSGIPESIETALIRIKELLK